MRHRLGGGRAHAHLAGGRHRHHDDAPRQARRAHRGGRVVAVEPEQHHGRVGGKRGERRLRHLDFEAHLGGRGGAEAQRGRCGAGDPGDQRQQGGERAGREGGGGKAGRADGDQNFSARSMIMLGMSPSTLKRSRQRGQVSVSALVS